MALALVAARGGAYTGRFFKPPSSLCPYPHDGPPCVCAASPAGVPALSAASVAWPQARDGLSGSALATPPATRPPLAMLPPTRQRRSRTAVRGSHSSVRVRVALSSHSPPSGVPHALAATARAAWPGA